MSSYREDLTYKALQEILQNAGITIIYQEVPDDSIDGAIWARADCDGMAIMMPENGDAFPDSETACCILGHEAGHILSGLNSTDLPAERRKNEAVCDLIGFYLYQLAGLTMEKKEQDRFVQFRENQ